MARIAAGPIHLTPPLAVNGDVWKLEQARPDLRITVQQVISAPGKKPYFITAAGRQDSEPVVFELKDPAWPLKRCCVRL